MVVGEAEELMAELVAALERGGGLPARLEAAEYPDVKTVPTPRYDLLEISAYQSIGVQWSRGCPFNCEFCDIIEIFGRRARTKTPAQLLVELDAIYATGFRGSRLRRRRQLHRQQDRSAAAARPARRPGCARTAIPSTCTPRPA